MQNTKLLVHSRKLEFIGKLNRRQASMEANFNQDNGLQTVLYNALLILLSKYSKFELQVEFVL